MKRTNHICPKNNRSKRTEKYLITSSMIAVIIFVLIFVNLTPIMIQNAYNIENKHDPSYTIDDPGPVDLDSILSSGSSTRGTTGVSGISQWDAEILWADNIMIGGITIGDLDPTRKGNEVVAVDTNGKVVLVHKTPTGTWETEELWQGEGQLLTPVIGDFYPGHDGNELIVVGMAIGNESEGGAGQATMIYGSADTWNSAVMFIAPDLLHGAAVGDLDPTQDGNEVVVMSFGYDVFMLTWNGTGSGPGDWSVTLMWHGDGKVRKGVIDDIDPNHPGNELVVVDKSGNCTMITGSGTTWNATSLWTDPGTPGLARVAVGDADPTYAGKEIIVGGDSNNVGIIRRTGNSWDGNVIFTDSDKIRGVAVGDVDPTSTGNEILVFSYSKRVTMLTGSGDTWKSRVLFTDTGRSHDLTIGECDPDHAGLEIVFVGYSNNITMLGVSPWVYEVMYSGTSMVGGCTIGDLDPTRKGNEVVAVDTNGKVILLHQTGIGTWETEELWQGEGQLLTPVIGNFYPGHDGNELIVVGMAKGLEEAGGAGQATLIYGSGDTWNSAVMYTAPDLLHGVAVGDLDPTQDGNEVVVMSFGYDVFMLTWNGTGSGPGDWSATLMWHGDGKVRKGVIDDIDPNHHGNELLVVDKSGNCTMITGSGTTWNATTLWTDPGTPGLARVAVGDAEPTYAGKEIIVGGDSNNVGIIRRVGDTWEGNVIFTDSDSIRGLAVGDVDPTHTGNEILVFSYSKRVTMLTGSGNSWKNTVLFTDTGRSHDLAVGEFDREHKGQELVFVGYSNNITMLKNIEQTEDPFFDIYGYPSTQSAYSGDTVEFTLGAISLGGFNAPVHFSISGLPDRLTASFYPCTVIPDSFSTLTLNIPFTNISSTHELQVNGTSGGIVQEVLLQLRIIGDTEAPVVEYTYPEADAEAIPIMAPIIIRFSESMDPQSLNESSVTIIEDESNTKYTGTFKYEKESNMLLISEIHKIGDTTSPLPRSKLIKVSIGKVVMDLAGNHLSERYHFKFITEKETQPGTATLEIEAVYPNKASAGIPNDSPIVIKFKIPMNSTTLNWENIKITTDLGTEYIGNINYDPDSSTLTIIDLHTVDDSVTGFINRSKVTVKLTTGISTIDGRSLSSDYSWSFDIGGSDHEDNGDEDEDAKENEFDAQINMYAIIMLTIIIILLLLMFFSKRQGSSESEPKPGSEPETKPKRKVGPKKRGLPKK